MLAQVVVRDRRVRVDDLDHAREIGRRDRARRQRAVVAERAALEHGRDLAQHAGVAQRDELAEHLGPVEPELLRDRGERLGDERHVVLHAPHQAIAVGIREPHG